MTQQPSIHRSQHRGLSMLIFFALVALLGLSACQPKEIDLPFETITQQEVSLYGDKEPGLRIVTKPEDADSLGSLVAPEVRSQLETVDYSSSIAIGVFQGQKPTTEYAAQIQRVTRRGNIVTVYALFSERDPSKSAGDLVTSPYHIVRVPKAGEWGGPITAGGITVASLSHYVP